jgi:hypothetical protein
MSVLVFALFLLWISFCAAKVEVAIEGAHGWAKDLPTWRLPPTSWVSRFFFSDKPATGYHIWLEILAISAFHLPYAFVNPSWMIESQIWSFFFFFCVIEDFLWFAVNPAFGVKNFRPEKIWWHQKHWWWIAPRDYYVLLAIAIFLYWLSFHF